MEALLSAKELIPSKIRRHLDDVTCARVINALVTSRLDFQNSLLLGLPQCQVERLQKAQNAAARLLTRTKKRQHITPILMDLHWLPVRARIDYKVMLLTHKVIHNQSSPGYLRELLCLRQPGRRLRSSNDPWLLAIPRSKGVFGDRSLCVAAPGLWNSLPRWMRALSDTEAFRQCCHSSHGVPPTKVAYFPLLSPTGSTINYNALLFVLPPFVGQGSRGGSFPAQRIMGIS